MPSKVISFSYTPFNIPEVGEKFRPVISIAISYGNTIFSGIEAMVDSGADKNLFPAWIGTRLGMNFNSSEYSKIIYGIGGAQIKAFTQKVRLHIYKFSFDTEIDFSFEQQIPLLGRDGFFSLFKSIKFKEGERFLDIELKDGL
jgi:hypothetical protein